MRREKTDAITDFGDGMDKKLFNDLTDSMLEMVAIERGEIQPDPENVHRIYTDASEGSEGDAVLVQFNAT